MSNHETNIIRMAIAEKLGVSDSWPSVLLELERVVAERDGLRKDAERLRTSFHKARRKLRELENEELSEAVENGGAVVHMVHGPKDVEELDKRLEELDSFECPKCSRVVGTGACPSCDPIEFVSEVAGDLEATKHSVKESGDCAEWCEACERDRAQRERKRGTNDED